MCNVHVMVVKGLRIPKMEKVGWKLVFHVSRKWDEWEFFLNTSFLEFVVQSALLFVTTMDLWKLTHLCTPHDVHRACGYTVHHVARKPLWWQREGHTLFSWLHAYSAYLKGETNKFTISNFCSKGYLISLIKYNMLV